MTEGTIVYVHGTGDREAQANEHATLIRERVAEAGRDFRVVASQWGRDAGSDLRAIHTTLPGPHADCGDELAAADVDLEMLRHDPLRGLTAAARPVDVEPAPSDTSMLSVALADQLLASAGTGGTRAPALATAEVTGTTPNEVSLAVRRAAAQVVTSNAYRDARAAGPADLDAAAVQAVAATAANDLLPASVSDAVWKGVVSSIQRWLGAGVVDVLALGAILAFYVQHDVPPSLGRWATDRLRPRRRCFMEDLAAQRLRPARFRRVPCRRRVAQRGRDRRPRGRPRRRLPARPRPDVLHATRRVPGDLRLPRPFTGGLTGIVGRSTAYRRPDRADSAVISPTGRVNVTTLGMRWAARVPKRSCSPTRRAGSTGPAAPSSRVGPSEWEIAAGRGADQSSWPIGWECHGRPGTNPP
jgi:hypothetical protein